MNVFKSFTLCSLCAFSFISPVYSQYSLGISGLLTVPSADGQADGLFMTGANYLSASMLPASFERNTGNYFVNITLLPFAEMVYRCILEDIELPTGERSLQQDRSVSLRLQVLKEKKYIPGLAVGSNDAFTTYELNPFTNKGGNRFFSSIYGVVSKRFSLGEHSLGLTAGYYLPIRKKNSIYTGFFCGIKYTPSFFSAMDLITDYNGRKVSLGASALFFKHVRLHLFTYGFKDISGGIRNEFILIPHKS